MAKWFKVLFMISAASLLLACGEDPPNAVPAKSAPAPGQARRPTTPSTTPSRSAAVDRQAPAAVLLLPAHPTAQDCLKAFVQGKVRRAEYRWLVNGEEVSEQTGNSLCSDKLRRNDQVEVLLVGTESRASVMVGNSPPQIVEVSATSEQALRRGDIRVNAVTEDADSDEVTLNYQWLVNGEEDLFSTAETLVTDRYQKGDTIQVKITPHDGIEEGETYASEALTIPNAPPRIISKPPEKFEALEYVYQVEASDPDGQKLTYQLAEAPEGMTIGESGQVNWSLSGVTAGTYPIKITVEDPDDGKTTQEFSITLAKSGE
ncbi:MAG: hypothetical protein A2X84_01475 [Desulfuromonadaceae bacterium GWC2_58_13]|nr:MAG: hypothetical protein A2X84_01475 [Desulfuromonadaceae bacterium GWC2_58_13]